MPIALIDVIPPSGIPLGPLTIGFYGVSFVLAVAVMILVSQSEARHKGIDPGLVTSAIIVVAICAIIGARLYHVIDDWHLYASDPVRALLPPYSGLGLYGGILGAVVGIWIFLRGRSIPVWRALDIVVPGTLLAQGIARWGNFFNQELYGPPMDAAWAIAIDCEHRIDPWYCPGDPRLAAGAEGVSPGAGFHPLFLYESVLDITGGLVALVLSRRFGGHLRDGDLASFWMLWYGSVRLVLESFRQGWNWTILGVPTAVLIGVALIGAGVGTIAWRHRAPVAPAAT